MLAQKEVRSCLARIHETLRQVQAASVLVDSMYLKEGALAVCLCAVDDPAQCLRAVATSLEDGEHLDQFKPDVVVTRAQVHSADALVARAENEDVMVTDQRLKELALLALLPRAVGALHEFAMGLLVQLIQPLVISRGCLLEDDFGREVASAIQEMLITPNAKREAMSAQQQATHQTPVRAPILTAPVRPARQEPRREPRGLLHLARHTLLSGVTS